MELIFIWYLLTAPQDRIACVLWTREPPAAQTVLQSCGFDDLADYRIDALDLDSNRIACSQPGGDAIQVQLDACKLPRSLDHYYIQIVQPAFSELVCSVSVEHEGQPTADEIQSACGIDALRRLNGGLLTMKYIGSQPKPSDAPPIQCAAPTLQPGTGFYDQALNVESLWTDEPLAWLAGRMIWNGMVRPICPGGRSGLDPITLAADACGLAAARDRMREWQNQYNVDIYQAAIQNNVPARLLKRIIAVESQYWPEWRNTGGEAGMLQVSTNGVDVLLRYDPDLDPSYPSSTTDQQYWRRLDVLRVIACVGCSVPQAVQHMHVTIPIYARLLAAYRCRAVEINPDLSGAAAWQQAAIDYNGDPAYIRKVEG